MDATINSKIDFRSKLLEEQQRINRQLEALKKVSELMADEEALQLFKSLVGERTEQRSQSISAYPAPKEVPVVPMQVTEKPARGTPRKNMHMGARKAILLALQTGPSTIVDLTRALVWEPRHVRTTLMDCERVGLVACKADQPKDQPLMWTLTTKGIQHAKFFMENPSYVVYRKDLPRGRQ